MTKDTYKAYLKSLLPEVLEELQKDGKIEVVRVDPIYTLPHAHTNVPPPVSPKYIIVIR